MHTHKHIHRYTKHTHGTYIKIFPGDETEVWRHKCALYLWATDRDEPEWVTRGVGEIRFLKHKAKDKTRLVLREKGNLKLRLNLYPEDPVVARLGMMGDNVCTRSWIGTDYSGCGKVKKRKNEQ